MLPRVGEHRARRIGYNGYGMPPPRTLHPRLARAEAARRRRPAAACLRGPGRRQPGIRRSRRCPSACQPLRSHGFDGRPADRHRPERRFRGLGARRVHPDEEPGGGRHQAARSSCFDSSKMRFQPKAELRRLPRSHRFGEVKGFLTGRVDLGDGEQAWVYKGYAGTIDAIDDRVNDKLLPRIGRGRVAPAAAAERLVQARPLRPLVSTEGWAPARHRRSGASRWCRRSCPCGRCRPRPWPRSSGRRRRATRRRGAS